jgi:outer membrane protein assembly factor BamB
MQDNAGNLYYTPCNPKEDVSLVCLNATTGERKWSIPGRGPAWGAVLILNNPEEPGNQLVYHSTRTDAYALRPDGSHVWHVKTGLEETADHQKVHTWGLNYHAPADALVGLTIDGTVFVMDRKTGRTMAEPLSLPCSPATVRAFVPSQIRSARNR